MVQRERTIPREVGILGVCTAPAIARRTEVRSMDQLIPSLAALVDPFRDCFHPQVFQTFQALLAGWIACVGPRTISEVWQATGLAARRHHDTAYAVFRSAVWEWDDVGLVLATLILTHLVPGGVVWVAVDDTLCHKRGAQVAFGGIFRRRALDQEAQDLAVRAELGRARGRRPAAAPSRPLLLPAGALAVLSQEGPGRVPEPNATGRPDGPSPGGELAREGILAGRRLGVHQLRGDEGPPEEPPSARAVAVGCGAVRAAGAVRRQGAAAQEG